MYCVQHVNIMVFIFCSENEREEEIVYITCVRIKIYILCMKAKEKRMKGFPMFLFFSLNHHTIKKSIKRGVLIKIIQIGNAGYSQSRKKIIRIYR
jgi:hypothetical protein